MTTMRFDTRQQMKLGQQMKLAPRMIQSMEILQLPLAALQERIEQELEKNVALELVEPGDGAAVDREPGGDVAETEREFIAGEAGEDFGRLADLVRRRKHPENRVTYIIDRNINPTNVCLTDCGFCAFYRSPGDPEAYVLSRSEIYGKVGELARLGGRQVLMQGGHHPRILSEWWGELISDLRERFPEVNSHALSAPELDHFAHYEKRPIEEVIRDLKEAGLGSVPGAGAEMLVERVRKIIAPKKTTTDRWLDVHRKIHEGGLRSSATMMFGHVETAAERIEHFQRVRDLQDETGGFTAFISWTCQPDGVPREQDYPEKATPAVYLRVQALSRIFFDNVDSIQTSYVTQGMKMGQMSLQFGANDFGGTMIEENVVSAAGCFHLSSVQTVEHLIQSAGFTPRQRNSWYGLVDERHDGPVFPANREDAMPGVQA